jgi:hypothetical protein
MTHNYTQNPDFNILTVKTDNGVFIFTGETRNPIAKGDYINYNVGDKGFIIIVTDVIERRDSKDYPEGNGMFYKVHGVPSPRPQVS